MIIRFFGREFIFPVWVKYLIISIVAVVLIVVGYLITRGSESGEITVFETTTPSESPPQETTETPPPTLPAEDLIVVYIVGEIKNPGVYEIPAGTILNELVGVAGGLSEHADREAVNLAFKLSNGMMIRIPAIGDSNKTWLVDVGTAPQGGASVASGSKVNINTATVSELCSLPGIGESTALKIINYRTENGPFKEISDITKVSGIKAARYNDIKSFITV